MVKTQIMKIDNQPTTFMTLMSSQMKNEIIDLKISTEMY